MSLRKQTPSDFLKQIIGRPVVVKLNSGVDYRGVLACLDGYMNIAVEQTEEYVNGQLKNKYGDAFLRGNNGFSHGANPSACADMKPRHIRAQPHNPHNNHITLHTDRASYLPGDGVPEFFHLLLDYINFHTVWEASILSSGVEDSFLSAATPPPATDSSLVEQGLNQPDNSMVAGNPSPAPRRSGTDVVTQTSSADFLQQTEKWGSREQKGGVAKNTSADRGVLQRAGQQHYSRPREWRTGASTQNSFVLVQAEYNVITPPGK
ncbi:hypothetical protein EOD39_7300 [Acipenser ruthenus]|uniref:U6 snRNA-associated Sm-like protein LSm6 n=1 Tax=Acipenser ruthenus TaxID=7906 RepID=A0A444U7M2_ACIRT|nr:hypothetical protein EOD39_7300 [Acipenser ruthenus]